MIHWLVTENHTHPRRPDMGLQYVMLVAWPASSHAPRFTATPRTNINTCCLALRSELAHQSPFIMAESPKKTLAEEARKRRGEGSRAKGPDRHVPKRRYRAGNQSNTALYPQCTLSLSTPILCWSLVCWLQQQTSGCKGFVFVFRLCAHLTQHNLSQHTILCGSPSLPPSHDTTRAIVPSSDKLRELLVTTSSSTNRFTAGKNKQTPTAEGEHSAQHNTQSCGATFCHEHSVREEEPHFWPCEAVMADISGPSAGHAARQRLGAPQQLPPHDPGRRPQPVTLPRAGKTLQLRRHRRTVLCTWTELCLHPQKGRGASWRHQYVKRHWTWVLFFAVSVTGFY